MAIHADEEPPAAGRSTDIGHRTDGHDTGDQGIVEQGTGSQVADRGGGRRRVADLVRDSRSRVVAGLRAWPVWVLPAVVGVTVGVVLVLRGGVAPRYAAVITWAIFATGVVACGSTRPTPLGDRCRRLLLSSVAASWALLVVAPNTRHIDWLFVSGVAVLLVGVEASEHVGDRFRDAVRSLLDREVLVMSDAEQHGYWQRLDASVRRWQTRTAMVVGAAIFLGWVIANGGSLPELLTRYPQGIVFESVAGVVAGQRLGRMFGHGNGWRLLRVTPDTLRLVPGHPDGAAGIRPMGAFYFRQSLVASLPGAYLTVWWFLFPAWPQYVHWRPVYLGLLPFAIAFEVLAFFVPMRHIHRDMAAQRRSFITDSDRLTPRIAAAQAAQAGQQSSPGKPEQASLKLADLLEWYKTLRQVPSWPVDRSLRRWFSLNNIGLLLPFLGYLLGNSEFWDKVGKAVGGLH